MKGLKILSTLLTLFSLALVLTNGEPLREVQLAGVEHLTLEQAETASLSGAAQYKTGRQFLSEVMELPFEFNLISMNWEEDIPLATKSEMEIRFRTAGEWGDWRHMHEDHDAPAHDDELWTYVITQNSNAFQYRVNLSTSDQNITPTLKNVSFKAVDGGEVSPAQKLGRLIFKSNNSVLSRSDWNANESLRYTSEKPEQASKMDDDKEYRDEEVKNRVEMEKGKYLRWPYEYPKYGVDKIIIHHTASEDLSDVDDYSATVRSIYQYHASARGWGDLGYNYLIDPNGVVYEGRAGGEGVVAGHTAGYNTGSVGIALIGNFESDVLPGVMMQSLSELVYDLSLEYDINPGGKTRFRGQRMENILGHRDLSATACPGEHAYDDLDTLRSMVDAAIDTAKNSSGELYSFKEDSKRELVLMDPEDKKPMIIRLKNTGLKSWNENTCLSLTPVGNAENIIEHDESKNCVATMKQSKVSPGKTGTFSFIAESNYTAGLAQFRIYPKFNGTKSTKDYEVLAYYVDDAQLDFELKSKTAPKSLKAGESKSITLKLKNTGNITWRSSGTDAVKLMRSGTSKLTSSSTLATLKESKVEPGEVGTFRFDIKAPQADGKHSLYAMLSMNSHDLQSDATSIQVSVSGGSSSSSSTQNEVIVQRSPELVLEPDQSKLAWVEVQNNSDNTWFRNGVRPLTLSMTSDGGTVSSSPKIMVSSLKPGKKTRVLFKITAPDEPGNYSIEIRPRLGSKNLTTKAYDFDYSVVGEATVPTENTEDLIRIKLTPEDSMRSVLVTSNEAFTIYNDSTALRGFSKGDLVRVYSTSKGFKVSSSGFNTTVDGPVRVSGGIIELVNFEQRPGWKPELNDNRFRGSMEFRRIDGELTMINELPLEDYLKGIGEVSDSTHTEKIKTILVLARSYAHYYMTQDEKFPGAPYHLDDSPERSQKYLGYGYELRSPNVSAAVDATEGQVVTYNGSVVKTPYFSQSDGVATKSAEEVWGWTHTPYLISVDDSHCNGDRFLGHGVGLSGCGSDAMAQSGKGYEEIIKYYYTGVELSEL